MIDRLPGMKPHLYSDPNHAGPIQERTETDWEYFYSCFIYSKIKTKARLDANMQSGKYLQSAKTLTQFYLQDRPTRRHIHKKKRNPEFFIGPFSR